MYSSISRSSNFQDSSLTPEELEEYHDTVSELSESTWRTADSSEQPPSSMNNNHPGTRPTTSASVNNNARHFHHRHYSSCHNHTKGHDACSCIVEFYEDDEVCRKNEDGHLEFGILAKYGDRNDLKIYWTLGDSVEEQTIDPTDESLYTSLRLIDRKCTPGDIVFVNKKRGEVVDVAWTCHLQIPENNLSLLNISCSNLEPLVPYYTGQKLEYSGWMGTITAVTTEATLIFTGIGKTGIVDCAALPQQPFPGRKVRYTAKQFIDANLRFTRDKRTVSQIFKNQTDIDAFVMFMNVSSVTVKWNGKIGSVSQQNLPGTVNSSTQPPTTLTKSELKRHAKVLGTIRDFDWEACHDAIDKYFQYTPSETDVVVPNGGIEKHIKAKYFDEDDEKPEQWIVKESREHGVTIYTNVPCTVRVVRFGRVLQVKWSVSGKIETIPASQITSKKSFDLPFHQLVQKSLSLSPHSDKEYGVTLSGCNDTVLVQWLAKTNENLKSPFRLMFVPSYQTPEPIFNIEPHFAFGTIAPREIVYRSVYCRVPEALFTLGWVRSVTQDGTVIVVNVHTKQEHIMFPPEIETTGMKIDTTPNQPTKFKPSRYADMVKIHGIQTLLNADRIFMRNLSSKQSYFPEHFKLMEKCPATHKFYNIAFSVRSDGAWMQAVRKDQIFLTTRMNAEIGSIWIKGFRDRLDLFSVLMTAPPGTPYEGGLYAFDLQIIPEYPCSPPAIYLHTSAGQLSPGIQNLELEDNVMPPHTLVGSLLALQCKLFTSSDPFEIPSSAASLQRRIIIAKDYEERMINAHVIIDVLDLMFRMVMDPPSLWTSEIINYFRMTFEKTKDRLLGLVDVTNPYSNCSEDWIIPSFPLMPVTDGFIESVFSRLHRFEELIEQSAQF